MRTAFTGCKEFRRMELGSDDWSHPGGDNVSHAVWAAAGIARIGGGQSDILLFLSAACVAAFRLLSARVQHAQDSHRLADHVIWKNVIGMHHEFACAGDSTSSAEGGVFGPAVGFSEISSSTTYTAAGLSRAMPGRLSRPSCAARRVSRRFSGPLASRFGASSGSFGLDVFGGQEGASVGGIQTALHPAAERGVVLGGFAHGFTF